MIRCNIFHILYFDMVHRFSKILRKVPDAAAIKIYSNLLYRIRRYEAIFRFQEGIIIVIDSYSSLLFPLLFDIVRILHDSAETEAARVEGGEPNQ